MTYNQWKKRFSYKKGFELHGIFTCFDMEGRVIVREIFVNGRLVFRVAPIRSGADPVI